MIIENDFDELYNLLNTRFQIIKVFENNQCEITQIM